MLTAKSILSLCGVVTLGLLAGCGGRVGSSEPLASSGSALADECAPSVPAALTVPDGNQVAFHYEGVGAQIYECKASGSGFAWVFQAPAATLYDADGETMGSHFAGPTWQSFDGSSVVGKKLTAVTVDHTAIPWLLLQATSYGPTDGRMDAVTYVQRLDTTGGLAPAGGCDATTVGSTASVGYSATYYFYKNGGAGSCQ